MMQRPLRSAGSALAIGLSATLVLTGGAAPAVAEPGGQERRPPARIALPDGFQPEGITIGPGQRAYFGSLADGDVYRADLRTGQGRRIHQGDGTPAVGLQIDRRARLWIAGGDDADAKVVDSRSGRQLARFRFPGAAPGSSFVNDVVLRRGAAWFTDSQRPVLYRVGPLGGRAAAADVRVVPLRGAWQQQPDDFNANGISTTPSGRGLLVVQSATGLLFRVDPGTGRAVRVRLGGDRLSNGDGMLRQGRTLYVVQNRLDRVAVVRLGVGGFRGRVVRTIRSARFDVPTTVARRGQALYLPNARFGTTPTPSTRYTAVRVPIRPAR